MSILRNILRPAVLLSLVSVLSCSETPDHVSGQLFASADSTLNAWHMAAAAADTITYFNLMDSTAVFIGTDPGERWTLQEFKTYVMPYFRQGKGWEFTAGKRNFRMLDDSPTLLFDEELDTWMGTCLSTGIIRNTGSGWKILHYHLAFTVPNEDIRDVIGLLEEKSGD